MRHSCGAIVSLSSDCNPGSSMTESMQVVMQLATLQMKMTVEESITAATLNGAHSLRLAHQIGSIEAEKRADLVLIDAPNYLHLVYHFGVNLVLDDFQKQFLADRGPALVRASTDVRREDEPRVIRERAIRRLGIEDVERQSAEVIGGER